MLAFAALPPTKKYTGIVINCMETEKTTRLHRPPSKSGLPQPVSPEDNRKMGTSYLPAFVPPLEKYIKSLILNALRFRWAERMLPVFSAPPKHRPAHTTKSQQESREISNKPKKAEKSPYFLARGMSSPFPASSSTQILTLVRSGLPSLPPSFHGAAQRIFERRYRPLSGLGLLWWRVVATWRYE